jgi:hypothetical protein
MPTLTFLENIFFFFLIIFSLFTSHGRTNKKRLQPRVLITLGGAEQIKKVYSQGH